MFLKMFLSYATSRLEQTAQWTKNVWKATYERICSFFIIVFFILLSMIMAVIMGAYEEVSPK